MLRLTLLVFTVGFTFAINNYTFPSDFIFGVSTAAYQIEGAWNYDGKGVNIWDTMVHDHPEYIKDGSNGDVAANSYFKYKEDIQLMKQLGVNFYRFSISWARILPTGYINQVNQAGINYYNNLINELLANGIQPVVTIFHWDLPQPIQDIGGIANKFVADIFVDYARVLFTQFGDRVKWWITINEPAVYSRGYTGTSFAPAIESQGIGDYLAVHTFILAHAKTFHMYNQEFRASQGGKVGITFNAAWFEPNTNSSEDLEAQQIGLEFYLGLHAHAIYSKVGDYPEVVKKRIHNRSLELGFMKSRLPRFSKEEVDYVRGTFDFFGLNHYSTYLTTPGWEEGRSMPSLEDDTRILKLYDPSWPSTAGPTRKVVPWGLRKLLNWIKEAYHNPPLFITENGVADNNGTTEDWHRVYYYTHYLYEVLNAIVEDGCNVFAYSPWSFIDNFEWGSGYTQMFGLYQVDFNDPDRQRIPKESSRVFTEILRTRQIPHKYLEDVL